MSTPSDIPRRYASLLAALSGDPADLYDAEAEPCPWEDDPEAWIRNLFPHIATQPLGPHHLELWRWVWDLKHGVSPRPFVAIWPRGGAKSSTLELAVVAAGALRTRHYALYVSATQDLADKHVTDIARHLEAPTVARYYPGLGQREVSKYGIARGWSGSRLRTAGGLMVDAIGLNAAARGIKAAGRRPDLIILDDVDALFDSPATTEAKIAGITQSILPTGSTDLAVLAGQNLIHPQSLFARLAGVADTPADLLQNRIVSGPHPAIRDLEIQHQGGRAVITAGTALWQGQDLEACQHAIDTYGETAFRRESQHEVDDPPGGMFDHIEFRHCDPQEVPDLVRVTVAVDPAVTDTDESDANGIEIDGLSADGTVYRLWSWEQRSNSDRTLTTALLKGIEYSASTLIVETDQGGDLWKRTYDRLVKDFNTTGVTIDGVLHTLQRGQRCPSFKGVRAGSRGSKQERAAQMQSPYERGRFIHVRGTHLALEKGLRRFPRTKPFDLVDASFWSQDDLTQPQMTGNRTAVSGPRSVVDPNRPG